jgi:hypothetical protein
MKKRLLQILVCLFHVICQFLKQFQYMLWEEIDFEILRSYLLLRLCDEWCSHQILSLTFDFTRLRLGLQIGIFGIIAEASDFPKLALQNCKLDMNTPLRKWTSLIWGFSMPIVNKQTEVIIQKLF